jgi:glycosyltransferase involved in cell wall biosynthesis
MFEDMKIISVSVMKNESDVVEPFVRHHLALFDEMIIVDHASHDSSAEIVRKMQAEGLPVELRHNRDVEFQQDAIINELLGYCARDKRADWIFPLDLDEFVACKEGADLRHIVATADREVPLRLPWKTYVPTSEDDSAEPLVFRRMTMRLSRETNQYCKVVVPGSLYRRGDCRVDVGSHWLLRGKDKIAGTTPSGLSLAHFPVRSQEQLKGKILIGWLSTLAKPNLGATENYHWKLMFDKMVGGGQLPAADLTRAAIHYLGSIADQSEVELVRDPVPTELDGQSLISEMRYEIDPVCEALVIAEQIALELGRLRTEQYKRQRRGSLRKLAEMMRHRGR